MVIFDSHLLRFSLFRKATLNVETESSRTQWLTLQVFRYEGTSSGDYNSTLWSLVILCHFSFRDWVIPYFQILWRVDKMTISFVMSVCLSVRPSASPFFCLSLRLSFRLSLVCPSVLLFSVCPSARPSFRLSVILSVLPSVCTSVRPSVCLSVSLFVRPSDCPSAWLSVCSSFRMEHLVHIRRIFMQWDIWAFFENMSIKFKLYYNLTLIMSTLHEDLCTVHLW